MEQTILKLKNDLIEHLNLEGTTPEQINDDEPLFGGGLGLDSIDALEIIVLVERNYGIKIKSQEAGQAAMKSVRSLAQFIKDNQ